MSINFQGKVAIVTGAGNGLGRSHALALAERGAKVVVNDLGGARDGTGASSDAAMEVVNLIQAAGGEAFAHGANVANFDEVEDMVAQAMDKWGRVDILINNAGIQYTASVEDFPVAKWDSIIAINLSSAFHTTRLLVPGMQKRGWGRIINIASVHGLVASLQKAAYVAAKHGIVGLTKVVALENAEKGITVNAICPGWVDTELVAGQFQAAADRDGVSFEEGKRRVIIDKQPMPQATQPSSLGELALFLCSEAAGTMTGSSLPIDGGWTAQ